MTSSDQETPMTDQAAADALVAEARRAVHESLTLLAAPEADRVRALIADLETAVEGRTAIRMSAPVPTRPAGRAALREAVAKAIHADRFPDHSWERQPEAIRDDYRGTADAVLAVLPEPTDRAAVLREAAALLDQRASGIHAFASSDFGEEARAVRELADAANELRRMADETAVAETCTPCSDPPCQGGVLCGQHEEEQAHAQGDHRFCGAGCRARQGGAAS